MAFGEYSAPGSGTMDTGLMLQVNLANGKFLQAYGCVLNNMQDEDLQKILNALAGIPGAQYAVFREGQVAQRDMVPTVEYEPLPTPPQD